MIFSMHMMCWLPRICDKGNFSSFCDTELAPDCVAYNEGLGYTINSSCVSIRISFNEATPSSVSLKS